MAKKSKKGKSIGKFKAARAAKARPKMKAKGKTARAAKTTRRPRKVTAPAQLDLIKGVRYSDLDRLCRNIGDSRDEINRAKSEDTDLGLKAIKSMRVHGVTAYKHAGITLVLVPGDEKLRVLKDRAGKASSGEGAAEPEATAVDVPADDEDLGDESVGEAVN